MSFGASVEPETVPFTEEAVKAYLDESILYWRGCQHEMAAYYMDAFQSVRMSLFGEVLPQPEPQRSPLEHQETDPSSGA